MDARSILSDVKQEEYDSVLSRFFPTLSSTITSGGAVSKTDNYIPGSSSSSSSSSSSGTSSTATRSGNSNGKHQGNEAQLAFLPQQTPGLFSFGAPKASPLSSDDAIVTRNDLHRRGSDSVIGRPVTSSAPAAPSPSSTLKASHKATPTTSAATTTKQYASAAGNPKAATGPKAVAIKTALATAGMCDWFCIVYESNTTATALLTTPLGVGG
jgi:hypothetical protein